MFIRDLRMTSVSSNGAYALFFCCSTGNSDRQVSYILTTAVEPPFPPISQTHQMGAAVLLAGPWPLAILHAAHQMNARDPARPTSHC